MAISVPFLIVFAKICFFFLFTSAATLIPLGIYLLGLACLALNLAGYVLLVAGICSLLSLLRMLL